MPLINRQATKIFQDQGATVRTIPGKEDNFPVFIKATAMIPKLKIAAASKL